MYRARDLIQLFAPCALFEEKLHFYTSLVQIITFSLYTISKLLRVDLKTALMVIPFVLPTFPMFFERIESSV